MLIFVANGEEEDEFQTDNAVYGEYEGKVKSKVKVRNLKIITIFVNFFVLFMYKIQY